MTFINFVKSVPAFLWLLIATLLLVTVYNYGGKDIELIGMAKILLAATLTAFSKETGIDIPAMKARLRKVAPQVIKLLMVAFLVISVTSCAQTTFYANGKPLARFQADMSNQKFTYKGNGVKISWSADTVNHSAATLAQGQAANNVLHGVATDITSAGIAVATSGAIPGGLGTLFRKF